MSLIKCSECGKEISDKAGICPHCGCPIKIVPNSVQPSNVLSQNVSPTNIPTNNTFSGFNQSTNMPHVDVKLIKEKGKWATAKLVIGIVSLVLFVLIGFQSCAAGLSNTLSSNGETSGSSGIIVALLMVVSGIVGIVTKNSKSKGGSITCCVLYWISSLFAYVGAGSFADLKIWGFLSFVFGYVYLLSIMSKKKGKIISTVCALLFFVFLIAVGSSPDDSNTKEVTEENGKIDIKNDGKNDSNIVKDDTSSTDTDNDSKLVSIEEQVLVDQGGIKITALEIVDDSIWGKGIKVIIENNSDKSIGVGCNALIVNNYMITDLFSSSIAAGKKSNETIYISSSELEEAGIENIGQVEIYFKIYDAENYNTIFTPEVMTIKTSDFTNMDTEITTKGEVLVDQDGIKIAGRYVDQDSFWGKAVLLDIENKSGKNVGINCDNMSINGFMVTPYFSSTVYDGKMAISDITIMSSDLEDNKIEKIEDLEVIFNIYDIETYDTIIQTNPISFKVQ